MIDGLSLNVLRYINKHPNQSLLDLQELFGENTTDALNYLVKDGLLINPTKGYVPTANGYASISSNVFKLSPHGRAYLKSRKADAIRYWIPIAISNAIAIAALVVSIVK